MNNITVASSPHISSKETTSGIMRDVAIALVPALLVAVYLFGARAALVTAVSVAACLVFETLWCVAFKKPVTIGDFSAVVTGMLLAFNLPASIPIWQILVGAFVSIIIVKEIFGGLGRNFVNPALAGRVVMALSFTSSMMDYSQPIRHFTSNYVDAASSATPLAILAEGGSVSNVSLFLGEHSGVLGEVSCLALLIGGVYLCVRGVIKPIIPVGYIASVFVFSWMFGYSAPLSFILSGGLFLGAIFMATDYVTSPYTDKGKWLYAICCGLLTTVIRMYSNSAEGVSYSILLMNLVVPYINQACRRKPYGTEVQHTNAR